MEDWLESLVPWGTEILVRIQALSGGGLDPIWYFFTFLGYEEFYLVALPLVYWCIHKRIGAALGYMAMLSTWLANAIKYVYNIPRPADPRLRIQWPESSPSFLSGHTVSAVANWGLMAVRFRKRGLWVAAIIAIIGIPASRMVLGVHFPQDILGGFVVGLLLLVAYTLAEPVVGRWLARQPIPSQLILAVVFPLLLLFVHPAVPEAGYPASGAVKTMAALIGLGVGLVMERALLNFCVDGPVLQRALRLVVGLLLVVAVYAGPKLFLPSEMEYRIEIVSAFVRYGLVGWTTAFFAPWLFVRVGLARRESSERTVPTAAQTAVQPGKPG